MIAARSAIFARTAFASVLRMRDDLRVQIEPGGLAFHFALQRGTRIGLTGKASVSKMPARVFPCAVRFGHLP